MPTLPNDKLNIEIKDSIFDISIDSHGDKGNTGSQGLPGTDGQGFNFLGAWNSSTSYIPYDVVTSEGNSYVCLTANLNDEPPSVNWAIMAAKGADGSGGGLPPGGTIGQLLVKNSNVDGDASWVNEPAEAKELDCFLEVKCDGQENQNIWYLSSYWKRIPFSILPHYELNDVGGNWDALNNVYIVPISGNYKVSTKLRLSDSTGYLNYLYVPQSYGMGANTEESDAPAISWFITNPERNGAQNERLSHFNAGDEIRMITYCNMQAANIIFDNFYYFTDEDLNNVWSGEGVTLSVVDGTCYGLVDSTGNRMITRSFSPVINMYTSTWFEITINADKIGATFQVIITDANSNQFVSEVLIITDIENPTTFQINSTHFADYIQVDNIQSVSIAGLNADTTYIFNSIDSIAEVGIISATMDILLLFKD